MPLEVGNQSIEERLRDVERTSATVSVSLSNMSSDIVELKSMFQKFLVESRRISELVAKVNDLEKLNEKTESLNRKYESLNTEFQMVKTEHGICQVGKTKSEKLMQDLHDRLIKIEMAVTSLTASKNKAENTFMDWVNKIGFMLFIGVIALIATHWNDMNMQPTKIEKPQSRYEMQIDDHEYQEFQEYQTYQDLRRKYERPKGKNR